MRPLFCLYSWNDMPVGKQALSSIQDTANEPLRIQTDKAWYPYSFANLDRKETNEWETLSFPQRFMTCLRFIQE